MGFNTFGTIFQVTTFGESHGPAIGAVIDGCPAGLPISLEEINRELRSRRPGHNPLTSPRNESDLCQILSGLFEGKTTGAPITLLIENKDADSSQYESIKHLLRPGHANFSYLEKYGIFDYRGGGRASARETAARVAAGAIAKALLTVEGIEICAYVTELGGVRGERPDWGNLGELKTRVQVSPVFCPDPKAAILMIQEIETVKEEGDSVGGIIEAVALHLPAGLGDPIYGKLEANLAAAMLSIPASKGFEIGAGFASARMKGSEHNDPFALDSEGRVITSTNFAGGTLGGISTGQPLYFQVPFKPTSSIKKRQMSVDLNQEVSPFQLPLQGRHDPCIAIRAVPVVEAMLALVLADALLANRLSKLKFSTV